MLDLGTWRIESHSNILWATVLWTRSGRPKSPLLADVAIVETYGTAGGKSDGLGALMTRIMVV